MSCEELLDIPEDGKGGSMTDLVTRRSAHQSKICWPGPALTYLPIDMSEGQGYALARLLLTRRRHSCQDKIVERTDDAHRYVSAFSEISGIFLYFGNIPVAFSFSVSRGTLRWHFFSWGPTSILFSCRVGPIVGIFLFDQSWHVSSQSSAQISEKRQVI